MTAQIAPQIPLPGTILIRIMVGGIFLAEGLQKFLCADDLGAGRFAKIGLPLPELLAPVVGSVEVVCGGLVLAGLLLRLAILPLLGVMTVAFVTTKLPILFGHEFWGLALKPLPRYGLLSMLHEARTDMCMICGLLFLLGSGRVAPRNANGQLNK